MNVHELPMVLFTIVTQMCIGAFLTLGVVQVVASFRHDMRTVERVTEPVIYAIGPAMVLGLAVSMLHMNDVTNVLNVFRHWGSSWLSREIIFGIAFAASGFAFALLEWFKKGSFGLRRVVALVTALLGIGLLFAESMVYYSLVTVPAWHTWVVPFHFAATAVILGGLAVGSALMITAKVRRSAEERQEHGTSTEPDRGSGLMAQIRGRVKEINAPTTDVEWALTQRVTTWISVVVTVTGVAVLASYAFYLGRLGVGSQAARESAAVFSGPMFVSRMLLLALSAFVLAFFAYRLAERTVRERPGRLVTVMLAAFALALVAEEIGRSLHYESMFHVGI